MKNWNNFDIYRIYSYFAIFVLYTYTIANGVVIHVSVQLNHEFVDLKKIKVSRAGFRNCLG